MRRYLAWALLLGATLSSCQMYDDLPVGTNKPAIYITKEIEDINQLLASSEHGWKMILLPGSYQYGGINFCFKFGTDYTVSTYSEDDATASHSTYRLYQSAGIRMTFDTRNPQLGRYAEPRRTLLQGLEGDFEFIVDKVSEDRNTIELIGVYSRNRMTLVRLTEEPEDYLKQVDDVRQALYGKALPTTSIGGEQVKMSIFGLLRQLQVKVGAAEPRLLPIVFTPSGIEVIDPEGLVDPQDASKGKIGQVGTELLREMKVEKTGSTYHVLSPSGSQLEIQGANFDLTKNKILATFFPQWAGTPIEEQLIKTNGYEYTTGEHKGLDSIPGEIAQDDWYKNRTTLSEYAYIGRTDGGDHKVSFKIYAPGLEFWSSYYLDFAAVSDEPSQIYIHKFVQDGDDWRRHRHAMQGMVDLLTSNSPYRITSTPSQNFAGENEFRMTSVANPDVWMAISNHFSPGADLSSLKVHNRNKVYPEPVSTSSSDGAGS